MLIRESDVWLGLLQTLSLWWVYVWLCNHLDVYTRACQWDKRANACYSNQRYEQMFSDLLLVIIYVSAQISLSLSFEKETENGNQKGKRKLDEESHQQKRWIGLFTVGG